MSAKRRKVSSGPLPVDCVGEICEFVWEPSVFLKLYTVSHHVKWYFDEEHPFACENVEFIAYDEGVEVTSEKKYVVRLKLQREISLRNFPNLKCLAVNIKMGRVDGFNEFYSLLVDLKYVEELVHDFQVTVRTCWKLSNECLQYFGNLKKVHMDFVDNVTDEGIKHLECVEDLSILGLLQQVNGSSFEFTKNLRILNVGFTGISDDSLRFLHQIEELRIHHSGITGGGLNNLPETVVNTLHTLSIRGLNIVNSDITRFKSLKHLINPFEQTGLTREVLRSLPNLEKLSLWPEDSSVTLCEIADNVKSEHFNELYISVSQFPSLKKFKNLTKLTISSSEINKKWIEDISSYGKNLEELTIRNSANLTTKCLDPLKNVKSLRKVKFEGCDLIPNDYVMKMAQTT